MTRFLSVLATSLTLSSAAMATDQVVVIASPDTQATQAKVVQAATAVCQRAVAHDYFGDFGSVDECVADAVANADVRKVESTQVAKR